MRERFQYLFIILLLASHSVMGQAPVIQNIEPVFSFPKSKIVISGSGFSSTPSQLQVWFGNVRGTIIASSDFSIEVEVPAQARLSSITVVNLSTRLSGRSKQKYMPAFNGEGFDPAKLATPITFSSANAVFDINSCDIDGDNKPDLIGSKNEATATNLILLLNTSTVGSISFTNVALPVLTIGAPTDYLATGDLNLDGKPDLVASRSGTTSNIVYVLTNTSTVGSPNFSAPLLLNLDIIQGAREVGIADMNGDGKPEIVVTNSSNNNLYIFKNESTGGTLSINPTPTKIAVTGAPQTLALELQDMDNDGMTDIVVTANQVSDLYLLKNVSTASAFTFSNITKIALPGQFTDLATADFNRDGKLDIVSTSLFTDQAMILMNNSTNTAFNFAVSPAVTTGAQPFGIDVCDLNGDGFPDVIIPNRGAPTINVYMHNGNLASIAFTKVTIPTSKSNWFVKAGDLDGDAKPDIAFTSFVATTGPFTIEILRNKNCHKPLILNVPPLTVCPSQTIRLLTIPMPGLTYDWSNGFNSIKNSVDPFADITAAATYTVTANGEAGACAVASAPMVVNSGAGTLPADPVITTNAPICAGSNLTLGTTAVSGATYIWTGPNNFTSGLQNPPINAATTAHAGIYSLTVKVGDCSSNTVTKRIDIVSFGSFAISSSSTTNKVCQGQPVTLTVNSIAGYSYQWIKDGGDINAQTSTTLIVNQEGAYKVRVTNTALGCSQETAPVSVVIYSTPVASFTVNATSCVGSTVSFTNNSVVDSDVPAASLVYAWEFGDAGTSNLKDPTHVYTTAQAFTPKLTVSYTGVTGCSAFVTKNITISNATPPVISSTLSALCANGSITAPLFVVGTFTTYLWSTSEITPTIDVTTPGDYTVETTDANNCKATASITLTEKTDCEPAGPAEIPYVFTPNGDTQNDFWIIPGIENKQECTMNIFDGRGRRIFQKKGFPIGGWDGLSDESKEVPEGTYYYVLSCPDETPATGSVLIVR